MKSNKFMKEENIVSEVEKETWSRRVKGLITKAVVYVNTVCMGLLISMSSVHAEGSNTQSIDGFITFVCDWLLKIGGVIALVGAVMFALGWQREDAEGKSRGLMTMMAGFMMVAISQSPSIFGL